MSTPGKRFLELDPTQINFDPFSSIIESSPEDVSDITFSPAVSSKSHETRTHESLSSVDGKQVTTTTPRKAPPLKFIGSKSSPSTSGAALPRRRLVREYLSSNMQDETDKASPLSGSSGGGDKKDKSGGSDSTAVTSAPFKRVLRKSIKVVRRPGASQISKENKHEELYSKTRPTLSSTDASSSDTSSRSGGDLKAADLNIKSSDLDQDKTRELSVQNPIISPQVVSSNVFDMSQGQAHETVTSQPLPPAMSIPLEKQAESTTTANISGHSTPSLLRVISHPPLTRTESINESESPCESLTRDGSNTPLSPQSSVKISRDDSITTSDTHILDRDNSNIVKPKSAEKVKAEKWGQIPSIDISLSIDTDSSGSKQSPDSSSPKQFQLPTKDVRRRKLQYTDRSMSVSDSDISSLTIPDRSQEKRDSISKLKEELLRMKTPTRFGARSDYLNKARKPLPLPPPEVGFTIGESEQKVKRPPLIKYCQSNRSIDETVDSHKISLMHSIVNSSSDSSPTADSACSGSNPDSPSTDTGQLLWQCYEKWSNEECQSKDTSVGDNSRNVSREEINTSSEIDEAKSDTVVTQSRQDLESRIKSGSENEAGQKKPCAKSDEKSSLFVTSCVKGGVGCDSELMSSKQCITEKSNPTLEPLKTEPKTEKPEFEYFSKEDSSKSDRALAADSPYLSRSSITHTAEEALPMSCAPGCGAKKPPEALDRKSQLRRKSSMPNLEQNKPTANIACLSETQFSAGTSQKGDVITTEGALNEYEARYVKQAANYDVLYAMNKGHEERTPSVGTSFGSDSSIKDKFSISVSDKSRLPDIVTTDPLFLPSYATQCTTNVVPMVTCPTVVTMETNPISATFPLARTSKTGDHDKNEFHPPSNSSAHVNLESSKCHNLLVSSESLVESHQDKCSLQEISSRDPTRKSCCQSESQQMGAQSINVNRGARVKQTTHQCGPQIGLQFSASKEISSFTAMNNSAERNEDAVSERTANQKPQQAEKEHFKEHGYEVDYNRSAMNAIKIQGKFPIQLHGVDHKACPIALQGSDSNSPHDTMTDELGEHSQVERKGPHVSHTMACSAHDSDLMQGFLTNAASKTHQSDTNKADDTKESISETHHSDNKIITHTCSIAQISSDKLQGPTISIDIADESEEREAQKQQKLPGEYESLDLSEDEDPGSESDVSEGHDLPMTSSHCDVNFPLLRRLTTVMEEEEGMLSRGASVDVENSPGDMTNSSPHLLLPSRLQNITSHFRNESMESEKCDSANCDDKEKNNEESSSFLGHDLPVPYCSSTVNMCSTFNESGSENISLPEKCVEIKSPCSNPCMLKTGVNNEYHMSYAENANNCSLTCDVSHDCVKSRIKTTPLSYIVAATECYKKTPIYPSVFDNVINSRALEEHKNALFDNNEHNIIPSCHNMELSSQPPHLSVPQCSLIHNKHTSEKCVSSIAPNEHLRKGQSQNSNQVATSPETLLISGNRSVNCCPEFSSVCVTKAQGYATPLYVDCENDGCVNCVDDVIKNNDDFHRRDVARFVCDVILCAVAKLLVEEIIKCAFCFVSSGENWILNKELDECRHNALVQNTLLNQDSEANLFPLTPLTQLTQKGDTVVNRFQHSIQVCNLSKALNHNNSEYHANLATKSELYCSERKAEHADRKCQDPFRQVDFMNRQQLFNKQTLCDVSGICDNGCNRETEATPPRNLSLVSSGATNVRPQHLRTCLYDSSGQVQIFPDVTDLNVNKVPVSEYTASQLRVYNKATASILALKRSPNPITTEEAEDVDDVTVTLIQDNRLCVPGYKMAANDVTDEDIWGSMDTLTATNDKKSNLSLDIQLSNQSPFDDNFDPFGDDPFGDGDPFSVQSPDPFDSNPFTNLPECANATTTNVLQYRSPSKSISSHSLYKITEEETEEQIHGHDVTQNANEAGIYTSRDDDYTNSKALNTPTAHDKTLDMALFAVQGKDINNRNDIANMTGELHDKEADGIAKRDASNLLAPRNITATKPESALESNTNTLIEDDTTLLALDDFVSSDCSSFRDLRSLSAPLHIPPPASQPWNQQNTQNHPAPPSKSNQLVTCNGPSCSNNLLSCDNCALNEMEFCIDGDNAGSQWGTEIKSDALHDSRYGTVSYAENNSALVPNKDKSESNMERLIDHTAERLVSDAFFNLANDPSFNLPEPIKGREYEVVNCTRNDTMKYSTADVIKPGEIDYKNEASNKTDSGYCGNQDSVSCSHSINQPNFTREMNDRNTLQGKETLQENECTSHVMDKSNPIVNELDFIAQEFVNQVLDSAVKYYREHFLSENDSLVISKNTIAKNAMQAKNNYDRSGKYKEKNITIQDCKDLVGPVIDMESGQGFNGAAVCSQLDDYAGELVRAIIGQCLQQMSTIHSHYSGKRGQETRDINRSRDVTNFSALENRDNAYDDTITDEESLNKFVDEFIQNVISISVCDLERRRYDMKEAELARYVQGLVQSVINESLRDLLLKGGEGSLRCGHTHLDENNSSPQQAEKLQDPQQSSSILTTLRESDSPQSPALSPYDDNPTTHLHVQAYAQWLINHSVAKLTAENVAKLTATDVAKLAAQNVAKLTADNVAKLTADDVAKLTADNVAKLTAENVAKLTAENVAKLTADNVAKLTADNVAKLTADNVAKLTSENVAKLTAENVAKLTATDVAKLTAQNVAKLTADDAAKLTADDVAKLTADNVAKLTAENVAKLTAENGAKLTADNVAKLTAENVAKLTAVDVVKLTADNANSDAVNEMNKQQAAMILLKPEKKYMDEYHIDTDGECKEEKGVDVNKPLSAVLDNSCCVREATGQIPIERSQQIEGYYHIDKNPANKDVTALMTGMQNKHEENNTQWQKQENVGGGSDQKGTLLLMSDCDDKSYMTEYERSRNNSEHHTKDAPPQFPSRQTASCGQFPTQSSALSGTPWTQEARDKSNNSHLTQSHSPNRHCAESVNMDGVNAANFINSKQNCENYTENGRSLEEFPTDRIVSAGWLTSESKSDNTENPDQIEVKFPWNEENAGKTDHENMSYNAKTIDAKNFNLTKGKNESIENQTMFEDKFCETFSSHSETGQEKDVEFQQMKETNTLVHSTPELDLLEWGTSEEESLETGTKEIAYTSTRVASDVETLNINEEAKKNTAKKSSLRISPYEDMEQIAAKIVANVLQLAFTDPRLKQDPGQNICKSHLNEEDITLVKSQGRVNESNQTHANHEARTKDISHDKQERHVLWNSAKHATEQGNNTQKHQEVGQNCDEVPIFTKKNSDEVRLSTNTAPTSSQTNKEVTHFDTHYSIKQSQLEDQGYNTLKGPVGAAAYVNRAVHNGMERQQENCYLESRNLCDSQQSVPYDGRNKPLDQESHCVSNETVCRTNEDNDIITASTTDDNVVPNSVDNYKSAVDTKPKKLKRKLSKVHFSEDFSDTNVSVQIIPSYDEENDDDLDKQVFDDEFTDNNCDLNEIEKDSVVFDIRPLKAENIDMEKAITVSNGGSIPHNDELLIDLSSPDSNQAPLDLKCDKNSVENSMPGAQGTNPFDILPADKNSFAVMNTEGEQIPTAPENVGYYDILEDSDMASFPPPPPEVASVDIKIDECSDAGSDISDSAPRIVIDECSSYCSSSDEERAISFPHVDINIQECSSNPCSSDEEQYTAAQTRAINEALRNNSPSRKTAGSRTRADQTRDQSSGNSTSDEEGEYIIEPRFREFSDPRFREIEQFGQIANCANEIPHVEPINRILFDIEEQETSDKISAENEKNRSMSAQGSLSSNPDIVIDTCDSVSSSTDSPDREVDKWNSSCNEVKGPDERSSEVKVRFDTSSHHENGMMSSQFVDITVDECSSNPRSSDEDEESHFREYRSKQNTEYCETNDIIETASDTSQSDLPDPARVNEEMQSDENNERSRSPEVGAEVIAEVSHFVDDVIRGAVFQFQEEERAMITNEAAMSDNHKPSQSDEFYSEEVKQMRDQIPEELTAPYTHARRAMTSSSRDTHVMTSSTPEGNQNNHTDSASSRNNVLPKNEISYDCDPKDVHLEDQFDLDRSQGHVTNESALNDDITNNVNASGSQELHESNRIHERHDNSVYMDSSHGDESLEDAHASSEDQHVFNGPESSHSEAWYSTSASRPTSLNSPTRRKIHANMKEIINGTYDLEDDDVTGQQRSRSSSTSTEGCDSHIDISAKTPDSLSTPEAMAGVGIAWTPEAPTVESIPEYTAEEEMEESRHWRTLHVAGVQYKVDIKVIEPYKQVLSHGGYYGDGLNAMLVFSACHLPDKRRRDYDYVMDNLFLYLLSTLELLVADDYMLIYLHGATPAHSAPPLRWLRRCQQAIDRRLKKNLKQLLIVHPTLWLKTVILMTKPFVSAKFYEKICYVKNLDQLASMVPMEYIFVPKQVSQYDRQRCASKSQPTTPS